MNNQDSSNFVDQNKSIFYASDAGWWINSECSNQDCCNITRIKAKDQLVAFKTKTNLTLKEIMEKAICTKCRKKNSIRLKYSTSSKKIPYYDARTDVVECLQSQDKTTKLAPTDEAQKDSKPNHSAISIDDTNEKHITQNMAASHDRRALIKETEERQKKKKILDELSMPEIKIHHLKKKQTIKYEAFRRKKNMVFHLSTCKWLDNGRNDEIIKFKSREDAISQGFTPCKNCRP